MKSFSTNQMAEKSHNYETTFTLKTNIPFFYMYENAVSNKIDSWQKTSWASAQANLL